MDLTALDTDKKKVSELEDTTIKLSKLKHRENKV